MRVTSVRRVEDITTALWGVYGQIEEWRNRPIEGEHLYVYLDGIWLKRSWGGEVRTVAVLVAMAVRSDGHREILGVQEGAMEDTENWRGFLRHLKGRGLRGVELIISDKCLGLLEAIGEFYPEASWQRRMVYWYRNVGDAGVVSVKLHTHEMARVSQLHPDLEDDDVLVFYRGFCSFAHLAMLAARGPRNRISLEMFLSANPS